MVTGIEIDFLPVGEGEHSGDAIAVRWTEGGKHKVMLYDGGTKNYGRPLVEHVKRHFGTTHVDYVVNSHPDNDHAGGLLYVLENLTVGELWIHQPWNYSEHIRRYFRDQRITDESLARRLQEKMAAAYALEVCAEKKQIPVYEPFAGCQIGIFTVLSPDMARYVHELIPEFEKAPELVKTEATLLGAAADFFKKAMGSVADVWDKEYLPDTVETSAENESSAILFATVGTNGYLLTGDAGIDSLRAAGEYAAKRGIDLPKQVTFAQIPHHGGRHNVSTETLDILFGPRLAQRPEQAWRTAFVSASEKAPRHPKKVVTNAFKRRGFKVGQTKGKSIWHFSPGMPRREGYSALTYLPFYDEVEE
ncbi:metallo-beta-lactamase superfamily protein [Paraburkholderia unamae]|uniref:ComEC/Rec2 family competence protein n=1 Tax=Paraburkholderia unamae TaxID=219649 RepID=UPI000DC26BC8|nr:MBL fold metallo-hydrolase [Paraburkholderia unamae]RAR56447.1 metallo-beta-lactamase superfamily protein [Paraburkholderia unamae]